MFKYFRSLLINYLIGNLDKVKDDLFDSVVKANAKAESILQTASDKYVKEVELAEAALELAKKKANDNHTRVSYKGIAIKDKAITNDKVAKALEGILS